MIRGGQTGRKGGGVLHDTEVRLDRGHAPWQPALLAVATFLAATVVVVATR